MSKKAKLASDPELGPVEDEDFEDRPPHDDESESNQKLGRSTYIIDTDFQYRFATTWILMQALYAGLIFVAFWVTTMYVGGQHENAILRRQITDLFAYTGIFIGALTLFFALYYMLLAHRISGPAYRLSRSLERVAEGDFDFEVSLRQTDYLKGVADSMNTALDSLRDRTDKLSQIREKVESVITGLRENSEENSDYIDVCKEVVADMEELESTSTENEDA